MISLPFATRQPNALRQRRSGQRLPHGIASSVDNDVGYAHQKNQEISPDPTDDWPIL
jgi:hypothetical protein